MHMHMYICRYITLVRWVELAGDAAAAASSRTHPLAAYMRNQKKK